jgi:predicted alpha/beta-hydrolase family hydrolase
MGADARRSRAQRIDTSGGPVSALWDGPREPGTLVVLAPGAGADLRAEFMEHFARRLSERGATVCRFNFLYSERGRKTPDRQPVLETTYREVLELALRDERPDRVVLGGKSMGGRIASHIVASGVEVDGLAFLGYPLHPPGKPERIRAAHLRDITMPMLFVAGTRDPFCPLETLDRVRKELHAPTEVFVVEGGDHSLKVRASSGRSTSRGWDDAATALADWVDRLPGRR